MSLSTSISLETRLPSLVLSPACVTPSPGREEEDDERRRPSEEEGTFDKRGGEGKEEEEEEQGETKEGDW